MYYVLFGGKDNVTYSGKGKTKAESRSLVRQLQQRKVPIIVVLWDHSPLAILTRKRNGKYRVRDWD